MNFSPSNGFCEVHCTFNSGSNAQGCLVRLKYATTGEEYCISLSYNNTVLGMLQCQSQYNQFNKSGMYNVTVYDIENNGSLSARPALANVMHTCLAGMY